MAQLLIALHSAVLEESNSGIRGLRGGVKGGGYMREGEQAWVRMALSEVYGGGLIALLPKSCHGTKLRVLEDWQVGAKMREETEHRAL